MALLCSVLKHVPDRTRVWNDGQDFRAPCRRCGVPMIKDVYAGCARSVPTAIWLQTVLTAARAPSIVDPPPSARKYIS